MSHLLGIARHPNKIAVFVSSDFKCKVKDVDKELFNELYLSSLVSAGDIKGKDSKVLSNHSNIVEYYEVGYYFGLIED